MKRAGLVSQTTLEIIIVVAIIIVLNIIGQYYYSRADLTADKQYTLAKSSKDIISNLPDLVYIKAYTSADLPPLLQQEEQKLRDILDDYRASASSKLIIQYITTNDMSEDEKNTLKTKGIVETPVQITEADQLSYTNVYMGLEISYLQQYKVVPFTPSVKNLEYDITSAILKLTSEETPTIGFLTGHGELSTQQAYGAPGLSQLAEKLKDLYNVQDVDLGTGQKIEDSIKTLVIPQPTQPFTERHRYVIDQFLMRGGKLIIMGNCMQIDQMSEQATFQAFPLDSLLASYGVKIKNDLVADLGYNWKVPGGNMGGFRVMMNYPLFPVISPPDGFPSDSPATRGLDSLVFPFVSSLELLYDKIPDDMQVQQLCVTSQVSYSSPLPVSLNPQQDFTPPGGEADLKKLLVAVQLNGTFTSAFAGQAIPAMDADPNISGDQLPELDDEPMLTTSQPTSLVVIGNASFIDDNSLGAPGNEVFIANLLESLNIGENLIDIRTRTVANHPINPELTTAEKNGLRFWGYFAVPILVTVFGVTRFYLKNQRKRLMQTLKEAESREK